MAMIDSSIYFQQKTPDIAGSIEQGMKMGDMLRQRRDQENIKQAYKAGMVQNPDGTYKQDLGITMSELAKGGYAQEYSSLAQQQKEQQAAQAKMQREQQLQKASDIGRLAGAAIQNPNAWMQIRKEAISKGYGTEESLPQVYDEKFLKGIQSQALTVSEQLGQQNKDREFSLKERELALKDREEKAKLAKGSSEGQKALDKDFAKDYNDWTSGGAKSARSEINKLTSVVQDLKNKKVTTGGLTGLFPDQMTSDKVLSARADVQSTVMNSLRAILGAQFTEKEGERIIKNTWNEADSTQNNVARLERLVSDLTNQAADKDTKARYYEQYGTLSGYKGMGSAPQGKTQNIAQTKPQTFKTNQIEWAD